ncbi:putative sugar phosphate/phosphate translocator [Canna indica]|uniref:Sugar phosphate/phosphate translocator n=1 Tax=Canna indica TaxID=4628 RepID=A0AAQ3JX35_9LILI|nr:putative sugar phosphate/phosphate translocator [Canna indica]
MGREGSGGGGGGGAGGGAMPEGVLKKVLLSYAYVAIWIFLSFTVIVYNKYILDPKMYGWPFPISLTMIHMAFCSTLAILLVRVFRVVDPPSSPPMSRALYISSVVPIGALYSLSLWFSNSAYIYLSVSFIQMLKALMPVAVYSIGILFKKESFKSSFMLNMLSISFGVAIAAYGEAHFNTTGVSLQLGAVAFEATRLVLIQILLTSKGISLNPITSLYYVAPCCFAFLLVPWSVVELPILRASTTPLRPDLLIFGTNSFCAFALNLAVFLLVGKTSALTMNVAGVVKDWLLIAFSWSVIRDTVTTINLFGYGIAFLGVAYYNHVKLQALKVKEAQKKVAQADEEAGKLLDKVDGSGENRKGDSQA